MFRILVIEALFVLLAAGGVGCLLVAFCPPVRRRWQRLLGRRLEQRAQYHCPFHGRIDPTDAVVDSIGSTRCPECYASNLSKGLY